MTDKKHSTASTTDRRPDCVTETRMGNTVLIVSGYFKKDTTATAADQDDESAGSGNRSRTKTALHRMSRNMEKRSCWGA